MKLRKPGPLRHEHRIFLLALAAGLPGTLVALILLWAGDFTPQSQFTPKAQWTLTVVIGLCWLGFAGAAQGRVVRPLQTLSNLLAALREGDYSIRARGARRDDALGE
jgi:hypothetical protein